MCILREWWGHTLIEIRHVFRISTGSDWPTAAIKHDGSFLSLLGPPVSASARRGVTLLEAVLFIAVALGLIVGGLVFYQQATLAARTQDAARQFSALVQETRSLYKGRAFEALVDATVNNICADGLDITAVLISAQAVPAEMIESPTELRNPWGGSTRVCGFSLTNFNPWTGVVTLDPRVVIISEGVPVEACSRLIATDVKNPLSNNSLTSKVRGQSIVSDGMNMTGVGASGNPPFSYYIYSPGFAAIACQYGDINAILYGGSVPPSSVQKLPGGTRSVFLGFALY